MCTLTYRLTDQGYQLFFNRDEQKTRAIAKAPILNHELKSAFPIDPAGGGTWIGVHESGLSLALLNNYQAQIDPLLKDFTSRGTIIPLLLADPEHVHEKILSMDLSVYQAFKLCIFSGRLSLQNRSDEKAIAYVWDGKKLTHSKLSVLNALPITSSSIELENVTHHRKQVFKRLINKASTEQDYQRFHQNQMGGGKYSVKMFREDAQTVSFTQISVHNKQALGEKVTIEYSDYLTPKSELEKLFL